MDTSSIFRWRHLYAIASRDYGYDEKCAPIYRKYEADVNVFGYSLFDLDKSELTAVVREHSV